MVGVVGSSPIEPTNEQQYICKSEKGNPGYDTANYNRKGFSATLVGIFFVFANLKKRG